MLLNRYKMKQDPTEELKNTAGDPAKQARKKYCNTRILFKTSGIRLSSSKAQQWDATELLENTTLKVTSFSTLSAHKFSVCTLAQNTKPKFSVCTQTQNNKA